MLTFSQIYLLLAADFILGRAPRPICDDHQMSDQHHLIHLISIALDRQAIIEQPSTKQLSIKTQNLCFPVFDFNSNG